MNYFVEELPDAGDSINMFMLVILAVLPFGSKSNWYNQLKK